MSLVTCALSAALGLVAGIVMNDRGRETARSVVFGLLDDEGDGRPGEHQSSRVWPAVL